MDINSKIIEILNSNKIDYKQNYNIDYRCDEFNIDFYLPDSKMFIILEYDVYNHEIYEDIKALGSTAGYKTTIIPIHDINNENELKQWVNKAIYYYNK